MFAARQSFAASRNFAARRGFSTTLARQSGHFAEGPYSNLPFKVHNRKIPYAIIHFGFLGFGFALPFIAVYWQLYKSGSL